MAVREEIVWRSAVVYFVLIIIAVALLVRSLSFNMFRGVNGQQ
jgi:hypothetical protein